MKRKAKKRPGRPSAAGGRVKFTTTLPADTVEALRHIGGGNASLAIIMLVNAAMAVRVTDKTIRSVQPMSAPK